MSLDKSKRDSEKKLHLINEEINYSTVLLVIPGGENRVVEVGEALDLAKKQALDLVLINAKTNPPIVKILDYGKFIYEIKKNKKGNSKTCNKVKSITVKPQISEHDIKWKADKAIEWLKMGDKVQFVVKAPGRMSDRADLIYQVYNSFVELLKDYGKPKDELKKISKIQYATYFFP